MTTLMNMLDGFGVLVLGLLVRLALFVLVTAALAAPVLLVFGAVKLARKLWQRAFGLGELAGLPWRSGLLHSAGHLWARPEADGLRLGLDGLAPRLFPGVERVALPMPGAELRRGEPIAEVVTAQRRVAIPAPVAGTVTRVNRGLLRNPRRIAEDPYVRGWLVTFKPVMPDLGQFLQGGLAADWFKAESARLARHLEQELGVAAADGGEPLLPPERALTEAQWAKLARAFLRAA